MIEQKVHKPPVAGEATVFCGFDVSAKTLAVAVQREDRDGFDERELPNSRVGHQRLVQWLLQRGERVRVSLEATGVFHPGLVARTG